MKKAVDLQKGFRAGLPIALGYLPIAVTFGILAKQVGLSALEATGMSLWVFAGASQFLALKLLESGVTAGEIILSTLFINFRHLLMSASLSQQLKTARGSAFVLSFGITDETFVVACLEKKLTGLHFFAIILLAYLAWTAGSLGGNLFAALIPVSLVSGMTIALYAMFIGLLIPSVKKNWKPGIIAALSALIAWTLTRAVPRLSSGWIIVITTLIASAAGILLPQAEKGST